MAGAESVDTSEGAEGREKLAPHESWVTLNLDTESWRGIVVSLTNGQCSAKCRLNVKPCLSCGGSVGYDCDICLLRERNGNGEKQKGGEGCRKDGSKWRMRVKAQHEQSTVNRATILTR